MQTYLQEILKDLVMNSNNFPILLLSNYRTGSSAMAGIIGKKYNLKVFREPHSNPVELAELALYIQIGRTDYIIKFMPDYIEQIQEYNHIYNSSCYKIKLTRRDKIAQITSYYIASVTNRWNNWKKEKEDPYHIDVNDTLIDSAIERIFNVDALLDKSECAEHMIYEDVDLTNPIMNKLLPPTNYAELYSYVATRINHKYETL